MKRNIWIGSIVVLGCAAVVLILIQRETTPQIGQPMIVSQPHVEEKKVSSQSTPVKGVSEPLQPEPSPPAITNPSPTRKVNANKLASVPIPTVTSAVRTAPVPEAAESVIPLPMARVALCFTGADPLANEVWAMAINDPKCSAHDRQDLIEDLNEEGFEDPKNLTLDDLPLILSRLELIEVHAPEAMDEVNADAFMEAYKDLVNMAARLLAQ